MVVSVFEAGNRNKLGWFELCEYLADKDVSVIDSGVIVRFVLYIGVS